MVSTPYFVTHIFSGGRSQLQHRSADTLEQTKLKRRQQMQKIKMDPQRLKQQVCMRVIVGVHNQDKNTHGIILRLSPTIGKCPLFSLYVYVYILIFADSAIINIICFAPR